MENTTINPSQSETLTESNFWELVEEARDDEYDFEYPEYDDVSHSI